MTGVQTCALPIYEIFNVSLTQTLHRTLITSGTTLMVILMLFLFGGPVLEGFSLTMLIGVSIGTASSIYVASALARTFNFRIRAGTACKSSTARLARGNIHLPYSVSTIPL